MIWNGDQKHWYVTRVDSSQDPPLVYGRPWGGWKSGEGTDRWREGTKPIGVEPDELILHEGDCVERFEETATRFGQVRTYRWCRPTTPPVEGAK